MEVTGLHALYLCRMHNIKTPVGSCYQKRVFMPHHNYLGFHYTKHCIWYAANRTDRGAYGQGGAVCETGQASPLVHQ